MGGVSAGIFGKGLLQFSDIFNGTDARHKSCSLVNQNIWKVIVKPTCALGLGKDGTVCC